MILYNAQNNFPQTGTVNLHTHTYTDKCMYVTYMYIHINYMYIHTILVMDDRATNFDVLNKGRH